MSKVCENGVLDVLCPMHLRLSASGHILHAGPTIQKMRPDIPLVGKRFLEVFVINRPRAITTMEDLRRLSDVKLHLALRDPPETSLKGVMVPAFAEGDEMIVNLSFGISILDGVRDYALTNTDFAATDLAIEMLYLVEAKTAAMEASYSLNQRLQGAMMAAEEQALTDTLTGVRNRRAMDHVLDQQIKNGAKFALMQVDLDFFKTVNDTLGHAAGDHVLHCVAQIMIEETRKADTVARVGGDEFTLILPSIPNEETLARVAERMIERIEQPIPYEGQDCMISASIGTVWVFPGDPRTADQILSDADVALYASKRAGRAQHTIYRPELRTSDAKALSKPG